MDSALITTLLGGILAGMFSQTVAVWVALGNVKRSIAENKSALVEKIDEAKCPFEDCPLWIRAKEEAANGRKVGG